MSRFTSNTKSLLKKDVIDALRNRNMGVLLIIPILMAAIFGFFTSIDMGAQYILALSATMALTMIPLSYLPGLIAEEKEKNTLRTLMLSGVKSAEFIVSKILVSVILMLLACVICYILSRFEIKYLPIFILITFIGSISLLTLGAVIGIGAKDQMATGIVSVPVMLLFLFPTNLKLISPVFEKLAYVTPVDHVLEFFNRYVAGESVFSKDNLISIGVIFGWIVVSAVIYVIIYRKRRFD